MDITDEMEGSDDMIDMDISSYDACYALSMESELRRRCTQPFPIPMSLENHIVCSVSKQKLGGKVSKVSTHIKRDDMIKDVVKMHVLPFLPAKALLKFRSVSKEWDKWIASSLLAHHQSFSFQKISGYFCQHEDGYTQFLSLDNSAYGVPCPLLSFMPEANYKVLSSCNGLLLCQCSDSYYVCNPTTKDVKMLPSPVYYHGSNPAVVLAFEPSLQNIEAYYHVICAFSMLDFPYICFEIYSSATNSWRCSAACCTELGDSSLTGTGFYLNGCAYWETSSGQVLAFNVQNEEPGIIPFPSEAARDGTFTQVGGELCYVTSAREDFKDTLAIDIYGGMDMSLKRSVFLNLELPTAFCFECKVLPGVDGDTLMILTWNTRVLLRCYQFSDQKVEVFCQANNISLKSRFFPYINSLANVA